MDIRQYEIYIDGHKLPRWFLTDADTQFGQRTDFEFDGFMTRLQPDGEPPASPTYTDGFMPWNVNLFAELEGRVLGFRLRETDDGDTAVRLISRSTNTNMHWQTRGMGAAVGEFGGRGDWELEWGVTYVIFVDYHGDRSRMTLRVVRCRVPLRDVSYRINTR
jgi:hypothetical protein